MKRRLSFFACLCMVLSLFTFGAAAAQSSSAMPDDLCSQEAWQLLKLTNRQRLEQGLTPLSTYPTLQKAVDVRVSELIKRYSHTRPDGTECFTALTEQGLGYKRAAENIAAGQSTSTNVFNAMLNSQDHKTNLLDPGFTHMGVGYTDQPCIIITETGVGQIRNGWVQLFMDDNCAITAVSPSQSSVTLAQGSSLESADLYLEVTCSVHGKSYMPLLEEMCQGYDAQATGQQTVTISCGSVTGKLTVNPTTPSGGGGGGGGFRPSGGSTGSSSGGSSATQDSIDVTGADSWAVNWIRQAHELSILSPINRTGYTKDVTRLQFADLAVCLAEQLTGSTITPAPADSFTDTKESAILKAKAAGIAAGYRDEQTGLYAFRPSAPITREEICVMLAHVVDYVTFRQTAPAVLDKSEAIKGTFTDTDRVESWAVKQVALMTNNGIMGGQATDLGNAIAPKANTTLQEAITLAVKLNTPLAK